MDVDEESHVDQNDIDPISITPNEPVIEVAEVEVVSQLSESDAETSRNTNSRGERSSERDSVMVEVNIVPSSNSDISPTVRDQTSNLTQTSVNVVSLPSTLPASNNSSPDDFKAKEKMPKASKESPAKDDEVKPSIFKLVILIVSVGR